MNNTALLPIRAQTLYCNNVNSIVLCYSCSQVNSCHSKIGVGNLHSAGQMQPTWTINMAHIRIFITRVRTQYCVKTKPWQADM